VYLNKTSQFSLPRVVRELTRNIRQFRPDIVYSRLPLANGLARIASLRTGTARHHVAGVDTVPAMYDIGYSVRHPGSVLFRWLERQARLIVCNSEGTRAAVAARGYPADRLRVVPNGIDIGHFRPPPVRPAATRPRLISVASLRPEKGVVRLVEVLAPFLSSGQAELILVGDGDERRAVEHTVARWGVGQVVTMRGALQDIRPALLAADLFVSAALVEGFGIAIAEAGASGLPAVAFAVPGGLSEVVIDGVTGHLVPEDQPDRFRRLVERLCSDHATRHTMGAAARAHVVQRFALESVVDQLELCFKEA
jgi:glycosyltransferase involved in cell wall biosynthesis